MLTPVLTPEEAAPARPHSCVWNASRACSSWPSVAKPQRAQRIVTGWGSSASAVDQPRHRDSSLTGTARFLGRPDFAGELPSRLLSAEPVNPEGAVGCGRGRPLASGRRQDSQIGSRPRLRQPYSFRAESRNVASHSPHRTVFLALAAAAVPVLLRHQRPQRVGSRDGAADTAIADDRDAAQPSRIAAGRTRVSDDLLVVDLRLEQDAGELVPPLGCFPRGVETRQPLRHPPSVDGTRRRAYPFASL